MNDRVSIALLKRLASYEGVPCTYWNRRDTEEIAFSRCALEEVLNRVFDRPWIPASETIEEFALRMEFYKSTAVTDDQNRIFSVAAETAWKLLKTVKELEK